MIRTFIEDAPADDRNAILADCRDCLRLLLENVSDALEEHLPIQFLFPDISEECLWDANGFLQLSPLDMVHFDGFNDEIGFNEWQDAVKLVWCLSMTEWLWLRPQAMAWWKAIFGEDILPNDLPPWGNYVELLKEVPIYGEGLVAIYQWMGHNTGNIFADVPNTADRYGVTMTWQAEEIVSLCRDYDESLTIFEPLETLIDLCEDEPNELRACLAIVRRISANASND